MSKTKMGRTTIYKGKVPFDYKGNQQSYEYANLEEGIIQYTLDTSKDSSYHTLVDIGTGELICSPFSPEQLGIEMFDKPRKVRFFIDKEYNGKMNRIVSIDNYEFHDTLTFSSSYRGRSAANFLFKRSDGTTVSFFLGDFEGVIPHMNGGEIRGLFTFRKQGANFGCILIKPN